MRKLAIALGMAVIALPFSSSAYPIQGMGASSCAKFAKMYQGDPENMEIMFFTWAQGFMSGLNLASSAAGGFERELGGSTTDQESAIRIYCSTNPLKTYMDAVVNLYGTLRVLPQKSN